jgi:uncharacterized lipoprotein YmbA
MIGIAFTIPPRGRRRWRAIGGAALCMAAAGCALLGSPNAHPTRFYVLDSVVRPDEAVSGGRLIVGIGPVTFPSYLNRPEMVTRVGENQLVFDEFHRWAEPLKDNFVHVLAGELESSIGIERVVFYPWYDTTPIDLALGVNVLRFERDPGSNAVLEARWNLRDRSGHVLIDRLSRFTRPAADPPQTAAALSDVTGDLAREIAQAMRTLDTSDAPANGTQQQRRDKR